MRLSVQLLRRPQVQPGPAKNLCRPVDLSEAGTIGWRDASALADVAHPILDGVLDLALRITSPWP